MGPLLAPLWNNGTLNGIDLHIYSSYSNNLAFASSAQSTFNKVKQASGITADINYIMTEYNFYYNFGVQTEQYGAQEFLTCMWDGWGVVKNDGHTSATAVTLVYDLYQPLTASTTYGLDYSLTPWDGTARADTLLRTLNLTAGMQFTYLDPLVTGIFMLQGQSANLQQKMWVWQNRVGWSSITGTSFTFSAGSLNGFNTLEIWGWDGLRNTLSINVGSGSYVLTNLNQGETYEEFVILVLLLHCNLLIPPPLRYMFLAIGPLSSSPLPDLIVQSVSWSPANPTTGQAVTFNAMVKNQGNAATPAGVIIGVGFSVDGTELTWSDNSTTSLAPGATRFLVADGGTNNGANTWTATTGTHTILAYVDDVNRITESNENNNQLTATVTVTAGLPDLIVQSISWSPIHPATGQSVVFSCVVKNQGNAATPAGVVIGVGFSVDGTELTWSDNSTTSLAPGATRFLVADGGTNNGANTWTATTGTHTILAYVDDVNRITESNENNNQLTATVTVTAGLPDLIVQSISWSPIHPATGQSVVFSCVVKNQGNAATPAGVVIGVGFSVDGTEVTWSDTDSTSLAAGATVALTADYGTSGVNYWVATTGTHTILAYVDDVNRIVESNENNNQLTATVTI